MRNIFYKTDGLPMKTVVLLVSLASKNITTDALKEVREQKT